jgi:hypothetical protein
MLIMLFRLLAVAAASAMVGVACVLVAVFIRQRQQKAVVPVTMKHLAMVALAVAGPMLAEVIDAIHDVRTGAPFYWYGSPLLFVSGCTGTYGLLKLMHFIRTGHE